MLIEAQTTYNGDQYSYTRGGSETNGSISFWITYPLSFPYSP